jgi:Host cell surface-exposed lipoprotein
MSAVYPPEYQQSPPQPPPLPPRRSWPRRHKILTALIAAAGLIVSSLSLAACSSAAHSPPAPVVTRTVTAPTTVTASTTGCAQINSALNSVFDGDYAGLTPAKTTGDLINNFLSGGTATALTPVMAGNTTVPGLRAAESRLNTDENALANTSDASSSQSAVLVPDLKAISTICGTSAWTHVTLTVATVTPGGTPSATATSAPAAPAAPAMTTAQQQAVEAAQGYLSMGSGFSQESLIKQLTSSYGSGFAQADAQFAVNYLNPNWDAQAVEAAQGYMQMGGFSASSLTQQLTSDYGDGFTQAQAEYAVAKVGL